MLDPISDRARGYMLLGIIYMHALIAYASVRAPEEVMASFVQIKLFSPHVSVFFLLSGMGARHIAQRKFAQVAQQGLALVLLAIFSHVSGFVLMALLHGTGADWRGSLDMLVRPIVIGTGYSTFVAWFFLALAMARVLTWLAYASRTAFVIVAVALTAAVLLSRQLGLPDNIYEWRTWPPAFVFFLIGTWIPARMRVPLPLGLVAGLASIALTWFNRPGVLSQGPCLTCDITFVSQPMVGGFGSIPVFLAQELLFFVFLIAVARLTWPAVVARPALLVGKKSAHFLLLNGWVILALNPWILPLLPAGDSTVMLVGLFVGSVAVHIALFRLLERPLDMLLLASFRSSDRIARLAQGMPRVRQWRWRSAD